MFRENVIVYNDNGVDCNKTYVLTFAKEITFVYSIIRYMLVSVQVITHLVELIRLTQLLDD